MAKVFVFNSARSNGMPTSDLETMVANYWGEEKEILFLIHYNEIYRLAQNGGYAGARVIDIEDPNEVRVKWLPFKKSKEEEFKSKDTNDYFFFLNDALLDFLFQNMVETDTMKKVLILKLLKSTDGQYSAFFLARTIDNPGAGGTSPTAGTKLP